MISHRVKVTLKRQRNHESESFITCFVYNRDCEHKHERIYIFVRKSIVEWTFLGLTLATFNYSDMKGLFLLLFLKIYNFSCCSFPFRMNTTKNSRVSHLLMEI